jgi:hypothetical protein
MVEEEGRREESAVTVAVALKDFPESFILDYMRVDQRLC